MSTEEQSKEPPQTVDIHIQYDLKTGALSMSGPYSTPVLFHGILSMARDGLSDAIRQVEAKHRSQKPDILVPDFRPKGVK